MLDRSEISQVAPADDRRALAIARRVLAMIVVAGGLLAVATWFKHTTCSCSGGLPYTTIGLWAGIIATVSFAVYVGLGMLARRG